MRESLIESIFVVGNKCNVKTLQFRDGFCEGVSDAATNTNQREITTKYMNINSQPITLSIWELSWPERFSTITQNHNAKARGYILCYSPHDRSTFIKIKHWMNLIQNYTPSLDHVILVSLCDIHDPRPHKVSYLSDIQTHNTMRRLPFYEVDLTNQASVNAPFHALAKLISNTILNGHVPWGRSLVPNSVSKNTNFSDMSNDWSQQTHHLFPSCFQQFVKLVMLNNRFRSTSSQSVSNPHPATNFGSSLSLDVWKLIFTYCSPDTFWEGVVAQVEVTGCQILNKVQFKTSNEPGKKKRRFSVRKLMRTISDSTLNRRGSKGDETASTVCVMKLVRPSKVVLYASDGITCCEYSHIQAKSGTSAGSESVVSSSPHQLTLFQRVWSERKQSHVERDLVLVTLRSEAAVSEWVSRINVAFISFE